MTRQFLLIAATVLVLLSGDASARNTIQTYSVAEFMDNPEYASRLQGVSFYFGNQPHPALLTEFGEFRTNKKTNAFNKSDKEACEWVMLSAMLSLHSKALSLGANAVVNIKSNYKNNVVISDTEFSCGAGGLMAGVALIGDFVTVE